MWHSLVKLFLHLTAVSVAQWFYRFPVGCWPLQCACVSWSVRQQDDCRTYHDVPVTTLPASQRQFYKKKCFCCFVLADGLLPSALLPRCRLHPTNSAVNHGELQVKHLKHLISGLTRRIGVDKSLCTGCKKSPINGFRAVWHPWSLPIVARFRSVP